MARKNGVWLVVATVAVVGAGCGGAQPRHHVRRSATSSPRGALSRELRRQVRNYLALQGPLAGHGVPPIVVAPGGPLTRPVPGGRACFVAAGVHSCSIDPCVVYGQTLPAVEQLGTVVRALPPGAGQPTPPCRHPPHVLRASAP